jgi:hypothetical protein
MDDECAGGDPADRVVGLDEEEPPRVRLDGVEQPAGEFEEGRAQQHQDRQALSGVRQGPSGRVQRRADEQAGVHAPKLGQ